MPRRVLLEGQCLPKSLAVRQVHPATAVCHRGRGHQEVLVKARDCWCNSLRHVPQDVHDAQQALRVLRTDPRCTSPASFERMALRRLVYQEEVPTRRLLKQKSIDLPIILATHCLLDDFRATLLAKDSASVPGPLDVLDPDTESPRPPSRVRGGTQDKARRPSTKANLIAAGGLAAQLRSQGIDEEGTCQGEVGRAQTDMPNQEKALRLRLAKPSPLSSVAPVCKLRQLLEAFNAICDACAHGSNAVPAAEVGAAAARRLASNFA
mmetsp:Transcript_65548/g.211417  ORF Transcript_65548/g.211417 Transcript_65548/m.211417 type:complete len:265 (+) Transcript_65548:762-1556(+)